MPRLTGVFESFNLEEIPPEDIARWLKPAPSLNTIENYLANKLLYPQTIPVTQADLAVELAIFREVIRRHPEKFQAQDKINISKDLADRIPLLDLTLALIDVLKPKAAQIVLQNKIVGSVSFSQNTWQIELLGKNYQLKR